MSVEIYICDLKPEVQEQVLSECVRRSAKSARPAKLSSGSA